MNIAERIKVVAHLQQTSAKVFNTVIHLLKTGMSEMDIAEIIKQEFKKRGIEEFWYDVGKNVLVGAERFKIGTTTSDYAIKAPSENVFLEEGSPVFIDLSPIDSKTKQWGDWASTIVFHPRKGIDDKQVVFLQEMRKIQRSGFLQINSVTTGTDVAKYFLKIFKERGITMLDVRNNLGHSIHEGPKDKAKRIWLDENSDSPLGEGFFAVEPGGVREDCVGRFEDCIYVPKKGNAILLGRKDSSPLFI